MDVQPRTFHHRSSFMATLSFQGHLCLVVTILLVRGVSYANCQLAESPTVEDNTETIKFSDPMTEEGAACPELHLQRMGSPCEDTQFVRYSCTCGTQGCSCLYSGLGWASEAAVALLALLLVAVVLALLLLLYRTRLAPQGAHSPPASEFGLALDPSGGSATALAAAGHKQAGIGSKRMLVDGSVVSNPMSHPSDRSPPDARAMARVTHTRSHAQSSHTSRSPSPLPSASPLNQSLLDSSIHLGVQPGAAQDPSKVPHLQGHWSPGPNALPPATPPKVQSTFSLLESAAQALQDLTNSSLKDGGRKAGTRGPSPFAALTPPPNASAPATHESPMARLKERSQASKHARTASDVADDMLLEMTQLLTPDAVPTPGSKSCNVSLLGGHYSEEGQGGGRSTSLGPAPSPSPASLPPRGAVPVGAVSPRPPVEWFVELPEPSQESSPKNIELEMVVSSDDESVTDTYFTPRTSNTRQNSKTGLSEHKRSSFSSSGVPSSSGQGGSSSRRSLDQAKLKAPSRVATKPRRSVDADKPNAGKTIVTVIGSPATTRSSKPMKPGRNVSPRSPPASEAKKSPRGTAPSSPIVYDRSASKRGGPSETLKSKSLKPSRAPSAGPGADVLKPYRAQAPMNPSRPSP